MGVIGKKSILKNYLLAYVGVAVAACAVLGLVLLNVSSRYMDQQERDAIQQRLISASDDFCYQMEQMERLSILLRTKERYQPFYLAKNAYNELEMIKDFAQYSGLVPIAGAYYLAYEDTAVVFSADAKIEYPLFTRQYADNTPYEDFIAAMHDGACFWRIETADKPIIFYKRPIYFNRYSQNSQADLLLAMNQAAMQERYASLFKLDEGLSIDVDGVTLLGEGTEQAAMAHSRYQGGARVTFAVKATPSAFSKALRNMLYLLIGLSMAFAALSAVLAYQNYLPVKRLAQKVGGQRAGETGNEIQAIADAVDDVIRQNTDSVSALTESLENISRLKESLKQQVLLRALSGDYDPALAQRLADAGLDMHGDHLCVAHIADDPAITTEALKRHIAAMSDSDARLYLARLAGQRGWALLMCAKNEESLMAAFDMVSDELTECFPQMNIRMGEPCQEVQKLAFSLAVAETAQVQDKLPDGEEEKKVLARACRMLTDGNEGAALESVDQLVDILEQEYPSALFRRYHLVEIVYQILECGKSLGCNLDTEELRGSLTYLDTDTVRKMLADVVRRICAVTPQAADKLPPAARAVMEYIDLHAADYDVCLDSVAAACDISTKQVSRIARSATGMSFKEYISNRRMRKAKRLLKEGLSSTDTANAVGYSDVSYFTKVFRTYCGCTPGQYREQFFGQKQAEQ